MIGHTTLPFSFDSDGEHHSQPRIWITEKQTSNLLGIEFCRQYVSKLHFELPAIEPNDTANAICHGNLCATQLCPLVSKVNTIRTPHLIHIVAKASRVWKYLTEDKLQNFPPGTTFFPHRHSFKSGIVFVNVLCTQCETDLPFLMENEKHQIALSKKYIGYWPLDVSD